MYEFHGWIRLLATCRYEHLNETLDDELDEDALSTLSKLIDEVRLGATTAEIAAMNGTVCVMLHGAHNRDGMSAELHDLFRFVAEHFAGSYGMLYEFNDQAVTPNGFGLWTVNVLKRGSVQPALDPFFSPTMPVVEDGPTPGRECDPP